MYALEVKETIGNKNKARGVIVACLAREKIFIMTTKEDVISEVFAELKRAEDKFPGFPEDVVHQAGILCEESGEAMQAALDYYYGRKKTKDIYVCELIQTAAMALRALFANAVD